MSGREWKGVSGRKGVWIFGEGGAMWREEGTEGGRKEMR